MREPHAEFDVVILAGGLGIRLNSVPGDLPKVLRPVRGRPFLFRLLDQAREYGARRVVLSLGFKQEEIARCLSSRPKDDLEIRSSIETTPLGTGGGLRLALPLLSAATVLAMNGDSFVDADLASLVSAHREREARLTILLTEADDASRFGRVEVDASGAVARFVEKGAAGPGLVNAGVYALDRGTIEEIPAGRPVSLEREFFPAQIGRRFFAVSGKFRFIDIGTPESYGAAEVFFEKGGAR